MSILANSLHHARDLEYLYRALYQRPNGTLYGLTFAALDAERAGRFSEAWSRGNRCLTVKLIRALQVARPQLVLV